MILIKFAQFDLELLMEFAIVRWPSGSQTGVTHKSLTHR